MNRKSFFKNALGAVAATTIGSKLDWIPDEVTHPIKPGIGGKSFKLHIPANMFRSNDLIMVSSGDIYFITRDKSGVLTGKPVMRKGELSDKDLPDIEFIEDSGNKYKKGIEQHIVRVGSAIPEDAIYTKG